MGMLKKLLDQGASIEQSREDGKTALMLAAVNGHEPVVKLLLESGAKPDERSWGKKETALMLAAVNGQWSNSCWKAGPNLMNGIGKEGRQH